MNIGDVTVGLQIGGLTTFFNGWAAALAVVVNFGKQATSALVKLGANAIDAGDEIQKLSDRIGFSTESLSRLKVALELSDSSLKDLQTGMKKMATTLKEAADGSASAAKMFTAVGVSVEQMDRLNPEERFRALARGIAAIEDPTKRAAAAVDLFGRGGDSLMPAILSMSSAAGTLADELGTVYSRETADSFARFNDMSTLLSTALSGLGKTLAEQVVPWLTPLVAGATAGVARFSAWVTETQAVGQAWAWLGAKWREFGESLKVWGFANAMVWGEMVKAADKMSSDVSLFFLEMKHAALDAVASLLAELNMMTGTGAGRKLMNAMGFAPEDIAAAIGPVTEALKQTAQEINDQLRQTVGEDNPLQSIADAIQAGGASAISSVGDLVINTTDRVVSFVDEATDHFDRAMAKGSQAAKKIETDHKASLGIMKKQQGNFANFAVKTFIDIVNGAAGSFSEILKEMLGNLGAMAMQEGLFHILAGKAKLASGLTAEAGRAEISAGKHLLGWGAAAVALGAAIGGGGGGASEGGGGGGDDGGGLGDRTGPGYEMDQEEKRQQVQVIVQGSMFDSRETWQRIGELARDHADADIRIIEAALGRA